jgi:hypothetical protein
MERTMSATMHHVFSIQMLDQLPGLFKPHRYLYHCVRCKWSFVVNDGQRGTITPVDGDGKALEHDEALKRAATFALGPCPGLQVLNLEPKPMQSSNGNGSPGFAATASRRNPAMGPGAGPWRNWAF